MGIFDLFTGGANNLPAEEAAIQNAANQATTIYGTGENNVNNIASQTQGGINQYLTGGTGATGGYINTGAAGLGGYANTGAGALNSYLNSGLQPSIYNFNSTAAPGTLALGNALGLNGAQGNATATQAFWNNPAIQSQLNIGTQNALRAGAAAGGGNLSGSVLGALQNVGQQTASQGWNNYIQNLTPYLNFSQGTAGNIAQAGTAAGTAAAALYGGAGNTYAGLQTAGAGDVSGLYGGAGNQAVSSANNTQNALAGLYGNQAQTTAAAGGAIANDIAAQTQATNTSNANALGAILGAGKLLTGSDERIKDDIKKVGELFDGQPVYRFRYKGTPQTQIGLMAQDVERIRPDAVEEHGGIKFVHYGKATDRAAALSKYGHSRHAST
jgi:Chaperone of endosialidase